jgi:ribosome-associated protein
MAKIKTSTDQLITHIIEGLENNKGLDIKLLDLREIENSICDYFIICSGTSNTHVESLAASVQKSVSKSLKEKPWHTEGEQVAQWILLDYVNVIVHVFQKSIREHYDLESLWGDAKFTSFSSTV